MRLRLTASVLRVSGKGFPVDGHKQIANLGLWIGARQQPAFRDSHRRCTWVTPTSIKPTLN